MEDIVSEVDAAADDLAIGPELSGPYGQLVIRLRDEINAALHRGHFRDAADLQQVIHYVLDNIHAGNLVATDSIHAGNLVATIAGRVNVVQEICF